MQLKQTIDVVWKGSEKCPHAFLLKGKGKLSFFPFFHQIERICFSCGRRELVTTERDNSNPFSFDAVADRFDPDD